MNEEVVTVSVPGKVHLMGEHAVVYGKPAILTAINYRMSVSIEASDTPRISTSLDNPAITTHIQHALSLVCHEYGIETAPTLHVRVSSEIPLGYHLGSSAALAVGVVGAASYFLKRIWNPTSINKIAYEVEKLHHGNPSGGDNTVVTFGGLLWYRKELEFLKSLWQLPFRLPSQLDHFLLINTGKPVETTKDMIELVAKKRAKFPKKMAEVFEENEECTKAIANAIKSADEASLLQSIHRGERTLEYMGVVSTLAQTFIRDVEAVGGAAKILGGGGRSKGVGFLLAYHSDKEVLQKLAHNYGFSAQHVSMGEEGVRLESGKSHERENV